MLEEKLDLITKETLALLNQIYKEDFTMKDAKVDLRGINMILDCPKEKKPKILGKRGKNISLVRKIVKLFGFMNFQANINIFIAPDVERLQQSHNS